MADQPGVSIRFVRQYKQPEDVFTRLWDRAFVLAIHDERDIDFAAKIKDALTFLRKDIH